MPTLKEYNLKLARLRGTSKMTRTMKMVSANKLRRAQEAQHRAAEFAAGLTAVQERLGAQGECVAGHPLGERRRSVRRVLAIVMTSDRGLCGGFNNNLNKKVLSWVGDERAAGRQVELRFIGRRGFLFFRQRGEDGFLYADVAQKPTFAPVRRIAAHVQESFLDGAFDEVYLAYNRFVTVLSQSPDIERLLPLEIRPAISARSGAMTDVLVEPAPARMLDILLPQIVQQRLYATLLSTATGEHAARMTAMENSTANAESLAETYTRLRNRARQAAITRELTEIVAGAEALN